MKGDCRCFHQLRSSLLRACGVLRDRHGRLHAHLLPSTCGLRPHSLLRLCGLCLGEWWCRGRSHLRDHRVRLLPSTCSQPPHSQLRCRCHCWCGLTCRGKRLLRVHRGPLHRRVQRGRGERVLHPSATRSWQSLACPRFRIRACARLLQSGRCTQLNQLGNLLGW